jgi:hypothetical protein
MTTEASTVSTARAPELLGQIVVVIGHRTRGWPADVAALAVHLMTNTAVTRATYDIDGGQQFIA